MTLMPAKAMGLKNRGFIAEGNKADLTLFDPKKVIDKATYEDPHQYSEGIEYVIVNGEIAVENKIFKPIKSGVILKKKNNER